MQYRIEFEGTNMNFFTDRALERLELLQKSQYQLAHDVFDHTITGHLLRANTLLVGQQLNPKEFHRSYQIFYPFYEYANSSLFLNEMLNKINVKEEKIMLTNVFKPDCLWEKDHLFSPHIKELYRRGIKNIVALGKETEKALKEIGVPFKGVPHPQYAKRFNIPDYDKILGDALHVAI